MASAGTYASLYLAPDREPRQHHTTQFFTGWMTFLPPNQQRQSNEGISDQTSPDTNVSNNLINCNKQAQSLYLIPGNITHTHTHTHLTALFPGVPRSAGTRKVKPIWILLKQETVSGSGISWAICKSAPCSRQIMTPASQRSVFYRPDALPAAQPTASKH